MNLKSLLALALLAPLGLALALDLRVEPEENNVTAGRLAGTWEMDPALCERLGVRARDTRLEFVEDDSFLGAIPAKLTDFLKDKQLYEAGLCTWRDGKTPKTYPYVLTSLAGNPHLIMFRERNGEALADAESCNLIVAPGKEHHQDILLMGADFNNEAFRPFRRVVDEQD